MSPTLRWPVSSPWALRRRGSPTAYLSTQQRVVLLYVARTTRRGDRTLEEISRVVGITSRGQVSRELRRLRQLELIGFKAWRGPKGRHRLWLPRGAARLRRALAERAHQVRNDSLSTPFGGFISRKGVESAADRGGGPLLPGRAAARDGPRRGHEPPRQLYATCPAGHSTRLGRRSWRTVPGVALRAVWTGTCRRCGGRPVEEVVEVRLNLPTSDRPLSTAELADPALLERRRAMAAAFERDGLAPRQVVAYRYLGRPE